MTPHDPTPTPTDSPRASPPGGESENEHVDLQQGDTLIPAVRAAAGSDSAAVPVVIAPSPPPAVGADAKDGQRPTSPDVDLFGNAPRHHPDWSHRRGEPRVFALIWTMFLTVLATTTLMRAAVGGRLDLSVYREALRVTLVVVASAIVMAWPLVRLSQLRPGEGGAMATLKDMLIVLVPLQAVIWPQVILAHWSVEVIAALDLHLAAWTLITGAIVAAGLGRAIPHARVLQDRVVPPGAQGANSPSSDTASAALPKSPTPWRHRTLAMLTVVLLLSLTGVITLLLEGVLAPGASATDAPAWWRLLSPYAGIYELTADRSAFGESIRIRSGHVAAIGVMMGVGVVACVAAWARQAAARPAIPSPEVAPEARAR